MSFWLHGVLLAVLCWLAAAEDAATRQYCIIGAGPGGLQMGYFLEKAGRDYVIFERNSTAGSFFLQYPRHRTLISINKRNTGSTNKEFNFRHDWNGLITDDETLQMKHYSKSYFPPADDYIRYLQDFASKQRLNVQYHTEIVEVTRFDEGSSLFSLKDQNGAAYQCRVLIASTGVWVPNVPIGIRGIENVEGYESVSIDPEDFEGKVVLILGRGNSGFEVADNIVGNTAFIHMASRSRIKMAYQTHYVGDLRAINNNLVDTYQLKSLDGQFEGDLVHAGVEIVKKTDGKLYLQAGRFEDGSGDTLFNQAYDVIIRCLGFKFDFSIYNDTTVKVLPSVVGDGKFPTLKANYEVYKNEDMFVAGTATHSLDFKQSAGGFIHGFRYTARALFRHLESRYHQVPWPSVTLHTSDLLNHLLRRINEASGPYQMFSVLVDVMLLRDNDTVVYLEEVPLQSFTYFEKMTGHEIGSFIYWNFEYGEGYSGPDQDVLREERVGGNPIEADGSNFLHPVIYYYKDPPVPGSKWRNKKQPQPDLYHHIVEDFLTDWTNRKNHVILLRRFLEAVVQQDLRSFFAETCFQLMFTYGSDVPLSCKQHYLQGVGISASDGIIDFGSVDAFEELPV